MVKISLACRKCRRKTPHAVFLDALNLPEDKALVQCYICEVMGIEQLDEDQVEYINANS